MTLRGRGEKGGEEESDFLKGDFGKRRERENGRGRGKESRERISPSPP